METSAMTYCRGRLLKVTLGFKITCLIFFILKPRLIVRFWKKPWFLVLFWVVTDK